MKKKTLVRQYGWVHRVETARKAIAKEVIAVSRMFYEDNTVDVNYQLTERAKEVQRKYGISICVTAMQSLLERLDANKVIEIKLSNGKRVPIELQYEPIVEYYNKFKEIVT